VEEEVACAADHGEKGAPMTRWTIGGCVIWLLIVLDLVAAPLDLTPVRADDTPPAPREAAEAVTIDMARGWVRRDWQRCADATRITFAGGAIAFESRSSGAFVWQVPTLNGPVEIDPTLDWVRACDRAPVSYFRSLAARRGTAALVDVSEYPLLSWRWRVEGGIDDSGIARADGRIRSGHDDFAAKVGVLMQARESDEPHEIAYVWGRSLPVGTVLHQDTTIIPFVKTWRTARLVVEAGEGRGGWVEETRDLRADFARLVPGEQAGRVLRVFVMTDSDDTGGRVNAAYAGIQFVRSPRPRPQLVDTDREPAKGRGGSRSGPSCSTCGRMPSTPPMPGGGGSR
jgi:hypothetical protein